MKPASENYLKTIFILTSSLILTPFFSAGSHAGPFFNSLSASLENSSPGVKSIFMFLMDPVLVTVKLITTESVLPAGKKTGFLMFSSIYLSNSFLPPAG